MRASDLKASRPTTPWMWREDWVQGRIKCHNRSFTFLVWAMALLWNGFMWPFMVTFWGDPDKRIMVKVLTLFCAVGLIILWAAVRATLAWFRFGSSFFELASNPGVIGGTLEGNIQTRLTKRPEAPVQLSLTCLRRTVTKAKRLQSTMGRRERDRSRVDQLWQGGRKVRPDQMVPGPRGLMIPVRLHIPFGLEATGSSEENPQIIWNLGAAADLPGVDFSAEFTVPVFRTEDSRPELTEQRVDEIADEEGALAQPAQRGESWVPPVVVRPIMSGGVEYTFRIPTTLKTAVGVTLLTLAVCAGTGLLFVWLEEAGPFALVPAAFGTLLLLATAVLWTFKSRVRIEQQMITVRKSVLGIPRTWRVPFAEVKDVRIKREVVEGVKADKLDWEIKIKRHAGEEVDIGAAVPNRTDAQRMAEEIKRLVG